MLCYRDRTYCSSPNCKDKCGRKLTDKVREGARKWWGKEGAPISVSVFCDENGGLVATALSKHSDGETIQ